MNFTIGKYKKGYWYAGVSHNTIDYLHKDGEIRISTKNNETGKYTGFWKTKKSAIEAVKKYNEKRR